MAVRDLIPDLNCIFLIFFSLKLLVSSAHGYNKHIVFKLKGYYKNEELILYLRVKFLVIYTNSTLAEKKKNTGPVTISAQQMAPDTSCQSRFLN